MKIRIEGTEEEIESKRFQLIKAVAGKDYDVKLKPVAKPPFYEAQREMLEYWTSEYDKMIEEMKKEIDEVI